MYKWSNPSRDKLYDCDHRLIMLFTEVLKVVDCSVITGHRTENDQMEAFIGGKSKVVWPNSKHNTFPAKAVDVAPYPIDWEDRERFTLFAGLVLGLAEGMGIRIRWGGDWDRDWTVRDNDFDDLVHFELLED